MQFRSIVALFIVICLVVITFFSNTAEAGKALEKTNRNNNYPNKKNLFVQRMKRHARHTPRRHKRQDDETVYQGVPVDGSNTEQENIPLASDIGSVRSDVGAVETSQYEEVKQDYYHGERTADENVPVVEQVLRKRSVQ